MIDYFKDFKISHNQYLWLIGIFIANFTIKIIDLDVPPFWYDEIISIKSAYQDFGLIKHTSEWDNNPPFYYYCLSIWIKLFGDSEFIVRLLSVIFSSLSAVVLFVLANKYFNSVIAIFVSFLFLTNNIIFYYSHEARAYSLVVLLSLLSTWVYFKLKNELLIKNIILLGLINFLLIYTHYISGLVIFFQSLIVFFYFDKKNKKYFFYSITITLGLILLRFTEKQFVLIFNFSSPKNTFWLQKSSFVYLREVLYTFLFNDFLYFFLFGFVIIIVFQFFKKQSFQFYIVYSLCLGLGSIIVLFLLGIYTPIFLDRYIIFSIPFLFLSFASISFYYKNNFATMMISILFFLVTFFKINFITNKNMDYRSTVNFIKKVQDRNDLVIVKTKDIMPLFGYYYEKDFLKNRKNQLDTESNIISCSSWEDVNVDVSKFDRVFVVDSYDSYNKQELDFVNKLSNFKTKYFVTNYFQGVKISVYQ